MASGRLATSLGDLKLRTPIIAASGTVGSIWEWASVADTSPFGAAVAKSVAAQPWDGRPPPRLAPLPVGMLNGVGVQNPGIEAWMSQVAPRMSALTVPVWGSTVSGDADGFAAVAKGLADSGVGAIEVNLSCPNLDGGHIFSFDPDASGDVVEAVSGVVDIPVGAKLSPETPDIVSVGEACISSGASFLTATNTALGLAIDLESRKPLLSGGPGGYSGPGLKPLALRRVYELANAFPGFPIVGCGGVSSGRDAIEYLIAGASAVQIGTALLADPKAGSTILTELEETLETLGATVSDVVGTVQAW